MLYLRATAAGLVGGAVIAVTIPWLFLRILIWQRMRHTDGGLGAASVSLGWTLLAGALGFLAVFFWVVTRTR